MAILILNTINTMFTLYIILLFVRIFGSWLPELQRYKFMHFVSFYTDPYLGFFKRFIPPLGVIDLSPIVAFLCLRLFIQPMILSLAYMLIRLLHIP